MSHTPAFEHPTDPDRAAAMLTVVRHVDLVLLVLAAPFVVLAGLPVVGFAAAAGTWIVTRLLGDLVDRAVRRSADPKLQAGLMVASLMGRAWAVGLAILTAGLAASREDGAMAAATALAAFSVYFAMAIVLRPTARERVPR